MEDVKIVELFFNRDERAIKEISDKYGVYCFSIARNILHNNEDAQECVSDAYMAAWNSIPPHRPAILSTFIGKITRRKSLMKLRQKSAEKRGGGEVTLALDELLECYPSGKTIDETLEEEELPRILNDFLIELPIKERRIFICRYWYLDSIANIAKQFNLSQSNVKSTLYRTRKKLLLRLQMEGVFDEI